VDHGIDAGNGAIECVAVERIAGNGKDQLVGRFCQVWVPDEPDDVVAVVDQMRAHGLPDVSGGANQCDAHQRAPCPSKNTTRPSMKVDTAVSNVVFVSATCLEAPIPVVSRFTSP